MFIYHIIQAGTTRQWTILDKTPAGAIEQLVNLGYPLGELTIEKLGVVTSDVTGFDEPQIL